MSSFIETQLAQMIIPELAQQVMAELKKHFDFDLKLNLAILSCTKNKEQGSIEFMICHIVPGEDSVSCTLNHEHFYSLVYKDNSWKMTLLKSSCSYIEYNYSECPLVPKVKEPLQLELELFDELNGQRYTWLDSQSN
jgi:hypothetical protein